MDADEEVAAEAASVVGAADASTADLRAELAAVDDMLAMAEPAALKPDARVRWLVQWIKANLLSGSNWNDRRLIIFTEWEDTRRWLERRLKEAIAETDRADERIAVFTGATGQDRREEVKAAFNADPGEGAAAHPDLHRCGARRHQSADLLLATSFTSICHGIRRVWNSATAVSTASFSRPSRSSAAISATSSARPTSCSMRWSARPR